jgi:hypothetical protein
MRNGLKAVLFLAAFSPSLISVGAARILSGGAFWDAIYYVIAGLIGTLSVVYILSALKWKGEAFPFTAKKVESNDALLFGVVFTYIFPFFVKAADVTVIVVIALGLVVWGIFWADGFAFVLGYGREDVHGESICVGHVGSYELDAGIHEF